MKADNIAAAAATHASNNMLKNGYEVFLKKKEIHTNRLQARYKLVAAQGRCL